MSDMRMYELEDIAWDEFDQINDHIVPQHSNEESEPPYPKDKPRHEVIGVSSKAGDFFSPGYVNQEGEGSVQPLKKKRTKLLEKDSTTTLSSDSMKVPGQSPISSNIDNMGEELSADDSIGGEGCAGNDTNSCPYSLGDMSQTENNLSFLDNNHEDNESTDLLYYGWPVIENFEDVDRMFSNEDDLPWLSSSQNIEERDGMLKSDFKVSCPELSPCKNIPEQDISKLNNASASADDSNISSYVRHKSGFQGSGTGEADPIGNMTFMNGSMFLNRGEFTPNEQALEFDGAVHFNNSTGNPINRTSQRRNKFQKKQASRPSLSEGKRKDRHKSSQGTAHPEHQKQKKHTEPNSFGYLQSATPYMHLNYAHPSDQISGCSQPTGIKTEINNLACISPRESSYVLNQVCSMESSQCHPLNTPFMSVEEKLEKLRRHQALYPSSVSKQVPHFEDEVKNNNGDNRAKVINPADIYSLNVPQTSCMSSGFDETSLQASSFHQLQQAMELLDIRTKLCIRDSLYRLARSAEQRHRYANMRSGAPIDGEIGDTTIAEGSNNVFMDLETDTNPIDRSVAHLLFHRPSDPSAMPAQVHGSITSPPMIVEQLVCQEEAASEAEKKDAITDDG